MQNSSCTCLKVKQENANLKLALLTAVATLKRGRCSDHRCEFDTSTIRIKSGSYICSRCETLVELEVICAKYRVGVKV